MKPNHPVLSILLALALSVTADGATPTEAPAGFDDQTIDPAYVTAADHQLDKDKFDTVERGSDGLGPLYNAQSCRECHQNPTTGAVSQVAELRVGHLSSDHRFEAADIPINGGSEIISGRTLVNDRALCAQAQERVPEQEKIRAFRLSLNTLGDGFVEALADETLRDLSEKQCAAFRQGKSQVCGKALRVPVLEAPKKTAIGRFGWKDQHASLRSFAADAYLNEMGITNTLLPTEITKTCMAAGVPEPNDTPDSTTGLEDVDHFARFMRAAKVPPRDEALFATAPAQRGSQLFNKVGCDVCHTRILITAAAGSKLLGDSYTVPAALGDKIIHPFSDFLLHDVGTGDGIAIAVTEHYGVSHAQIAAEYGRVLAPLVRRTGEPSTAARAASKTEAFDAVDRIMAREGFSYKEVQDGRNRLRTPPLWGLRTHSRLMHDGASVRLEDAILRHGNEARASRRRFQQLGAAQKHDLLVFLGSL